MSRFLLGCLAISALALMVDQAIAGGAVASSGSATDDMTGDGGVVIIETYSSSSSVGGDNQNNSNDMKPLPGNPGVEVAPDNGTAGDDMNNQPVMVEEGMMVQETEDGE